MDKQKVEVKGEGLINSAQLEWGMVPLADLPILRKIPSFDRKVSFISEGGEKQGGVKLPEEEWPLTVLQKGDKVYLVSQKREVLRVDETRNVIMLQYFVRTPPVEGVSIEKPRKVGSFASNISEGKVIADFLYDGNNNIPALILHYPGTTVGYKNSFYVPYSRVAVVDLLSGMAITLSNHGDDTSTVVVNGKNLVGVTVPVSKVREVIHKTELGSIEKVFESDLERIIKLNKQSDRGHMCWGDSSCISEETFELVLPKKYPKYRMTMDSKGKVYRTERISEERFIIP